MKGNSKKMTAQVRIMVESVNESMRYQHSKDEHEPTFATMGWLLLEAGCYHGFNWFDKDGRLCHPDKPECDHVAYYIA